MGLNIFETPGLWHKGVFVMSYLWSAGLAEYDGNDIKAKRAVFYIVRGEKIACRPEQSGSLALCDGCFGWAKGLIGFGSDLDKDDGAVGIDHDKVELAGLAGEVAGERSEAFTS